MKAGVSRGNRGNGQEEKREEARVLYGSQQVRMKSLAASRQLRELLLWCSTTSRKRTTRQTDGQVANNSIRRGPTHRLLRGAGPKNSALLSFATVCLWAANCSKCCVGVLAIARTKAMSSGISTSPPVSSEMAAALRLRLAMALFFARPLSREAGRRVYEASAREGGLHPEKVKRDKHTTNVTVSNGTRFL